MIINLKGDAVQLLQDGLVDGLVHCCNARGVMGAGIAAQVKDAFPTAYNAYAKECFSSKDYPDELLGTVVIQDNVFNLIGQLNTGKGKRQVDYGALARGFVHIAAHIYRTLDTKDMPYRLAVPKFIGCGLAGGDWYVVSELLTGLLGKQANIILYIVEFEPK